MMTSSPTKARIRRRERVQRQRERSPALAATLSALTFFLVALLIFIVEMNIPTHPVRNFFRLVAYGDTTPGSQLYLQLMGQIEREDMFFVTPLSLFCAGLVLGRLTPRRIAPFRLLRIAAAVSFSVVAACILFRWGLILYGQHGHLRPGEIDTQLAETQTLCIVGWLIAYLIGAALGVLWRGRPTHQPDETP